MRIDNMNKILFVALMVTISTMMTGTVLAATSAQSSSVGYQDGIQDCGLGTSFHINNHSNAGHHSAAYMQGYNEGLNNCSPLSPPSPINQNDINQNNRNEQQTQGAVTTQHCFVLIGTCDGAKVNQGQDLTN